MCSFNSGRPIVQHCQPFLACVLYCVLCVVYNGTFNNISDIMDSQWPPQKLTREQKERQRDLLERMVATVHTNIAQIDMEDEKINMYQYVEDEDGITYTGTYDPTLPADQRFHSIILKPDSDIVKDSKDSSDSKIKKNSRAKISPSEKNRLAKIAKSKEESFKAQKRRDKRSHKVDLDADLTQNTEESTDRVVQRSCVNHGHLRSELLDHNMRFGGYVIYRMFTYGGARLNLNTRSNLFQTPAKNTAMKISSDRWLSYYTAMYDEREDQIDEADFC